MTLDTTPIARALISVSDKSGLEELAKALTAQGVEIISTGGTAEVLSKKHIPVRDVADVTQFPEMMDGRLKTLHPRVHGGLLAIRGEPAHQAAMIAHAIPTIDLLIVNLYPFEQALARHASFEEMIENIDIGGPAMIRAAAKNHHDVVVIVDVADYDALITEMNAHAGGTSLAFRRAMAQKAYARTAAYDATISNWFAQELKPAEAPTWRAFGGKSAYPLRYGENPHQKGAFYITSQNYPGVATAKQLQGKELSYNNINDTDAAYQCVAEFPAPAVVIVKHANPCGIAQGATLLEAYERALACDLVSAFGGVIALNAPLDESTARKIVEIFTEVIIAPAADEAALHVLATKKNLRLLLAGGVPNPAAPDITVRSVAGGLLVQDKDHAPFDAQSLKVVTKRHPNKDEWEDLQFAWHVCKHVKSNAIVFAKAKATIGIGAGQMSRVDSALTAARKAGDATRGSVVASDAFFPFPDGLTVAIEAGATAVIQPGGAMRDADVIAAADAANLAMIFTGIRHFRH